MKRGYIKYWRASVDNKLYFAEPFTKWQAWSDLLILANHKDSTVFVRGIPVTLKKGQVMASDRFLAERWKWSRGKVRRFLQWLVQQDQIICGTSKKSSTKARPKLDQSSTSKTVQQTVQQNKPPVGIISIVNWELYQGGDEEDGTTNGATNGATNGPQTGHKRGTPKNVKNVKNVRNTTTTTAREDSVNLIELYENNVGTTGPMQLQEMAEYQETCQPSWIQHAIKEAVDANARNWKYVRAVLDACIASNGITQKGERKNGTSNSHARGYSSRADRDQAPRPGHPDYNPDGN